MACSKPSYRGRLEGSSFRRAACASALSRRFPGRSWDDFRARQLPKGAKGDKGDPGTPGAKGDQGLPGLQGIQGIQGTTGPAGPRTTSAG